MASSNTLVDQEIPTSSEQDDSGAGIVWRIAWRNLWRNRRRTWLTAGGIAFACLLVCAGMALQGGSYASMVSAGTGFFHGQIQVNHPQFIEEKKLEHTLEQASTRVTQIQQVPGVTVAPRIEVFALASVGERSFGGMILGVDFAAELEVASILRQLDEGVLPAQHGEEVVLGRALARNLGAKLGDDLIILGTAKQGGIAALALQIVGVFDSGQAELDRTLVFAPLAAVQEAFATPDEVHTLALGVGDIEQVERIRAQVEQVLVADANGPVSVRSWPAVMPEIVQAIELDRVSAQLMYGAILILVTFSVINTFLMVVFERTREFGMLMALGMRPVQIMVQVQLEAMFVWLLGVGIGLGIALVLIGYLAAVGIPMAGMEEVVAQFYMPDRIYPAFTVQSLTAAPLFLLIGTQFAALLATLRLRKIRPVEALRSE